MKHEMVAIPETKCFTRQADTYRFHGGCHGCTRQNVEPLGVEFCRRCQYFDADWNLPSLNNRPLSRAELKRREMKSSKGIAKSIIRRFLP